VGRINILAQSRVRGVGRGQARKSGVEVLACDGDVVQLAGANSILHAKHGRPLAKICDVSAGQSLGCAGQLCGQPVVRQPRVQLQPAQVVFKYVCAAVFVGEAHPDNLIEAAWAA
jgi:hypothetical protein